MADIEDGTGKFATILCEISDGEMTENNKMTAFQRVVEPSVYDQNLLYSEDSDDSVKDQNYTPESEISSENEEENVSLVEGRIT